MTISTYMTGGLRRCAMVVALLVAGLTGVSAQQPQQPPPQTAGTFNNQQIEQMVAPIALYPDDLISQVLMASTYPLEVVEAARWVKENPKVTGQALQDAMLKQPWDPSVKALAAVPQTLAMMSDQLKWTQDLGDAFLGQQSEVFDAIQRLRARADAAGNLKSTPQQTVTRASRPAGSPAGAPAQAYVIQSASPTEYYVPIYDPGVVYGAWPYATYSPFYWYPPGYVASGVFGFAAGVAAGAAIWGGMNWWNRNVNVNVNRYNQFNRTNISNSNWQHNAAHRHGVAYNNPKVAQQFGQGGRDKARDNARQNLANKGGMAGKDGKGGMAGKDGKGGMAGGMGQGGKGGGMGQGGKGGGMGQGGKGGGMGQAGMGGGMGQAGMGGGMGQGGMAGGMGGGGMGGGHAGMGGGGMMGGGHAGFAGMGGGGGARMGMAGGGGRGGGGGMGGGGRRSDITLKHDIALIGHLDNGLGFYRFAYKGSDVAYVGVMAQDVQRVRPDAVTRGRDGTLRVFYDKLGVTFQTYRQWLSDGAQVPAGAH